MKKVTDFFKKIAKWTSAHKTAFALIMTALFVAIHIPLLLNHEITVDEGTSWQLSQEITPSNIYDINSAEPHPLLWQIILAPFSKLNFPVITLNIISLVLVASAVFLMFRFSPINNISKFIFMFSCALFYFLPIISRDYSLVPLAICLIGLTYKKRHEKPFLYGLSIAFLSQTHFLMYGLVAALSLGYVIELTFKKLNVLKLLKTLALFSLPILVSIASVVPIVTNSMNNQAVITGKYSENTPEDDRIPFIPVTIYNFFGLYNDALGFVFIASFIIIFISFLSKNPKTSLYLFAGIGLWYYVLKNIYTAYAFIPPKIPLLLLMPILIIWLNLIEEEDKTKENLIHKIFGHSELVKVVRMKTKDSIYIILTTILALSTIPHAFTFAIDDLNRPFSNAKEISGFINEKVEPGSLIIEGDTAALLRSAVISNITNDVTIYNNILGRIEQHMDYLKYDNETIDRNRAFKGLTNEELEKRFEELSKEYEHVYYLAYSPSCTDTARDNNNVVSKYERVAVFNDRQYLDIGRSRVSMYKIK